jgi:hypothetical protein
MKNTLLAISVEPITVDTDWGQNVFNCPHFFTIVIGDLGISQESIVLSFRSDFQNLKF